MKPAAFLYDDPSELADALALRAEHGHDAVVLAGGQSLLPLLSFRLARPTRLIDINRVGELAYVRDNAEELRIGALTRHAVLERHEAIARRWPLIGQAMPFIGHPQIRNRGTIGGSVAHADPAAELPAVFVALGARFHVKSTSGARIINADDMFTGHYTTDIRPDELLCEIEIPAPAPQSGTAFLEHARSHGAFALAGAAAVIQTDEDGHCVDARLVLLGAGDRPVRAKLAETSLIGRRVDCIAARDAGALAAEALALEGAMAQSGAYGCALIVTLAEDALLQAAKRATPDPA